jgi:hypothetical protein
MPASNTDAPSNPHGVSVGAAAASLAHVPTCPGRLQRTNGSVQAVLQQMVSTQKLGEAHCDAMLHAPPIGTGVLVGVAVAVTVGVAVGVAVCVAVRVAVTVAVAVVVGVAVIVAVAVMVGVAVCVSIGVNVGVAVAGHVAPPPDDMQPHMFGAVSPQNP